MDPRILINIVFLLFVVPHFFSLAAAQYLHTMELLPQMCSSERRHDPGIALHGLADTASALSSIFRNEDIPDTAIQVSAFPGSGIPVYNSSLMMMVQGLLSRQEVLLEYFPTDTLIYIMMFTRESVKVYMSKTGREFWQEVKLFQRRMRLADFRDYRKQSEILSDVLLGKVAMRLKEKTKAVVVAHSLMNGFPFEALVLPAKSGSGKGKKRYLVEELEIVYNTSVFQWLKTRMRRKLAGFKLPAENKLAFVGFSPGFYFHECVQALHDADTEINKIGRMFSEKGIPPLVLMAENSNEYNFRSVARFSNILHIATHSIKSDEFPEMNGLLFHEFGSDQNNGNDDDGILAVHEICDLQIPADLIVLNSCSSANIRSRVGINWFSCPECFMKAGASNVLCTLWNVTDRFAEQFMVEFYRNYLTGMSFSKALQKVKVMMINDAPTSLPVNWAAYILIGE